MQKIWCGLALLIAIALVPSLYLNRFLSWWCLEKWDSLRQSQVTTYGIYPNFNIWFSCSSPMTKFTILMLGSDLWYQLLNCLNMVNALDYDYPTKAHPSDAQQLLHLQNATSPPQPLHRSSRTACTHSTHDHTDILSFVCPGIAALLTWA